MLTMSFVSTPLITESTSPTAKGDDLLLQVDEAATVCTQQMSS